MAYIQPSVLVYQQLEEAGGVLNATPDLEAVIVGPLYNNVYVDPADGTSLSNSETYTLDWLDRTEGFVFGTDISFDVASNLTNDIGGSDSTFYDVVVQRNASITLVEDDDYTLTRNAGASPDQIVISSTGTLSSLFIASDTVDITVSIPTDIDLPLPAKVVGQETESTSVTVHMTDAEVQTNEFTIADLSAAAGGTSLISAVTTQGELFTTPLPDNTANHANAGDRVLITYDPGGGDVVLETYITEVVGAGSIRVADVIPDLAVAGAAVVYHPYQYIQIGSAYFDAVTEIASEIVVLDSTAHPYGGAGAYAYAFISGTTHIGYTALRLDSASVILDIDDQDSRLALLGVADENNPLSLAVDLALRNTTTRIKALAIDSDDSAGYASALDVLEGEESAAFLVPLTQSESVITSFSLHCQQLSTPEEGLWRSVIANTDLPEVLYLLGNETLTETGTITNTSGTGAYITDSGKLFLGLGIQPGDTVTIVTSDDALPVDGTGTWEVESIIDNDNIEINGDFSAVADDSNITYYVSRELTKGQQAEIIGSRSETWNTNRVWHVWPDTVGVEIDGVTTYLPGYYLCAAHAGANAGFPVQQGMTNIAVAGIVDLQHSNFYFSRADLNSIAEKGTCIYSQASQGGTPFCRHALTTDVSVLEYREQLKVKNWDFLSYYYKDKLSPFVGSWNITADTLSVMRQVIISSSELLVVQRLPKIGPPLLSYEIVRLEQNENNKDQVDVELKIEIVSPLNYINVFLVI